MPKREEQVNNQVFPEYKNAIPVWFSKLCCPKGKAGVITSILVAIVFVLLVNAISHKYLEAQPPDTHAFSVFTYFRGIQTWDTGVDILILGDSTGRVNLEEGSFSDRLGGQAVKFTVGGTSLLMDAWMLSAYVEKFGAPDSVIISHNSPTSYNFMHSIEFMAAPHLPWNYWNELGIAPAWQEGELIELFITKYAVLYSYGDILRERFINFWDLFDYAVKPVKPTNEYFEGSTSKQRAMDINHKRDYYTGEFNPSADTTNALSFMSTLAREKHFQLYIVFQPEWDEAVNSGIRKSILDAQVQYLSQFTDSTYVHIIRDDSLTFTKEQMQNPNHLRPGVTHIKTESDLSEIISIQNSLTAGQAQPIILDNVQLNRNKYKTGKQPRISLTVSNLGTADVTGSVSCLAKPSGNTDGYWVSRASAVTFEIEAGGNVTLELKLSVGELDIAGVYDLVVFLRQDVGNLSNEVRVELPGELVIK